MSETQGQQAARGRVSADRVGKGNHAAGLLEALKVALDDLDGQQYGGKELQLAYSVEISANPGGISGYICTLVSTG